jgi:hypothetical protein
MNGIRFVTTGVHAYFDYIGGIALLVAPFLFGFYSVGGAAVIVPPYGTAPDLRLRGLCLPHRLAIPVRLYQ